MTYEWYISKDRYLGNKVYGKISNRSISVTEVYNLTDADFERELRHEFANIQTIKLSRDERTPERQRMFEITLNGVEIKHRHRPKHLARLPQEVVDEMEIIGYHMLKTQKCAVALCKTQVSPLIRKWVEIFRPEEVKEELISAGHIHSMPFTIWLFPKEGMDSDPMIFLQNVTLPDYAEKLLTLASESHEVIKRRALGKV